MRKAPVVFLIAFILFFMGILYLSEIYPSLSLKSHNDLRIGMIMYGSHNGGGLSEAHYDGVSSVAKEKGLVLEYFENVEEDESCRDKIDELIKDGCELIILDSGRFADHARAEAVQHPNIYFLSVYGRNYRENLSVYSSRMYQASYLAGIVAGLQTDKNRIGYVSGYPTSYFKSDVNAFTLGVRKYNRDAEVFAVFCGNEGDTDAANKIISDHDIDVLECNTYSDRSLFFAEKAGMWSIGCHRNNYKNYPRGYLTAEVCNWKDFYRKQIESVLNGTFRGSSYLLGIDSGTVGLAKLTGNVKKGISEKVAVEEAALLSGRHDVFYGPIYDSEGGLRIGPGEIMPDKDIYNSFNWYVPGVRIDGQSGVN